MTEEITSQEPQSDPFIEALRSYVNEQNELPSEAEDEGREENAVGDDQAKENAKPEDEAQEDEQLFTVKIDGEEKQVTKDELIASFQKGLAADQRFSEAAALRKEIESQKSAISEERTKVLSVLDSYTDQLKQLMQGTQPDWDELIATDPQEYLRQKHIFEQRQIQLQEATYAQSVLQQQQAEEAKERQQSFLKEQSELLLKAIPEWADEAKKKTENQEIVGYLRGLGYDDSILSRISDHREVLIARKAMLYDKMVSEQAKTKEKIKNLPPVRAERSTGKSSGGTNSQYQQHMSNLRKTGSIESAALALTARLQGA